MTELMTELTTHQTEDLSKHHSESQDAVSKPGFITRNKLIAAQLLLQRELQDYCFHHHPNEQRQRVYAEILLSFSQVVERILHEETGDAMTHLALQLTKILLKFLFIDDSGPSSNYGFFPSPQGFAYPNRYAREYSIDVRGFRVDLTTDSFYSCSEITRYFAILRKDEIAVTDINSIDAHQTTKSINRFKILKPFLSIKDMEEQIDKSFENLAKPVYATAWVKVNEDTGIPINIVATESGNSIYSLRLSNYLSQPTTHASTGDIWDALVDLKAKEIFSTESLQKSQEQQADFLESVRSSRNLNSNVRTIIKNLLSNTIHANIESEEELLNTFLNTIKTHHESFQKWQIRFLYKMLVSEHLMQSGKLTARELLESRKHKLEAHYSRFFSSDLPANFKQSVILTKSGVSANSLAMAIASVHYTLEEVTYKPKYAYCQGWYFENRVDPNVGWEETKPEKADVLFINIEPSEPQKNNAKDDQVSKTINNFLRHASQFPEKKFFIILDRTNDLLKSVIQSNELQNNVVLIETASFTKYQRGARTHAFGVVSIKSETDFDSIGRKLLPLVTGVPTLDTLVNFPRIGTTEIEDQYSNNRRLAGAFAEEFEKTQKGLPRQWRWQWSTQTPYGFVIPPDVAVTALRSGDKYFHGFLDGQKINQATYIVSEKLQSSVERGDGFGLNQTRLSSFGVPIEIGKSSSWLSILRISYGRETTIDQMRQLAAIVGEGLATSAREVFSSMPRSQQIRAKILSSISDYTKVSLSQF